MVEAIKVESITAVVVEMAEPFRVEKVRLTEESEDTTNVEASIVLPLMVEN